MMKIKIKPKNVEEVQHEEEPQQSVMAISAPSEAFCKYNEATERCIYNPDASATANDEQCYKTEKNRCASKKKKMMKIKIKPKKAKETLEEEEEKVITHEIEEEVLPPVKKKNKDNSK
jgi:hypothetical protein